MGEMAEDAIASMYDQFEPMSDLDDGYWRTREGKLLKLANMTDSHLFNTFAMLDRKGLEDTEKFEELVAEMERR